MAAPSVAQESRPPDGRPYDIPCLRCNKGVNRFGAGSLNVRDWGALLAVGWD